MACQFFDSHERVDVDGRGEHAVNVRKDFMGVRWQEAPEENATSDRVCG